MTKFGLLATAAAVATLGFAGDSSAATLDFTGIDGDQGPVLSLPNATLTAATGVVFAGAGAAGAADGFCFTNAAVNSCEGDGEISFASTINNLTFDLDGFDPGDDITISAYLGATLLGGLNFTANGLADFTSFGTLDRLVFDDNSTGFGFGFSTFAFDEVAGVVPLPAGMVLMLTGVAGLGFAGRRRKVA